MDHYCTLFDSNYLTRGLAMYQSLVDTGDDFELYIFAFDDWAYEILARLSLPRVVLISLSEFETDELLAIKQTRQPGEYCWTCTSFSILHVLEHYDIDEVTYLDADLFFFTAPRVLLDEFHASGKDVMITRHNYTAEYDQSATSGIYCVQFMTFRNNANGLTVLRWWTERCAEWCYARLEDGKFGDQKYLDDWTERFDGVHVMTHRGGGIGPWNVQQFACTAGPCVDDVPVVFYHFHGLRWLKKDEFELSCYRLSPGAVQYLYKIYVEALKQSLTYVQKRYKSEFQLGFFSWPKGFLNCLRRCKYEVGLRLRGCYNVYKL